MRSGLSLSRPAGEPTTPPLARPPARAGHFQHRHSPAPTSSICSRAARSDRAGAAAGAMSVAPRRACAPKGSAHLEERRRWRRSGRSRNGGGQPRGSTRQEACQRWAAPARAARIALPQQVRLEGWSTRLSGRRKGGCGENGTDAPPEALDTNDGPQPARHGQQGRCRRS